MVAMDEFGLSKDGAAPVNLLALSDVWLELLRRVREANTELQGATAKQAAFAAVWCFCRAIGTVIVFPAGDVTLWKKSPLAVHVTSLYNLPNEVERGEEAARQGRSRHFRVPWLLGPTDGSGNAQKLESNQSQYYELAALEPMATGVTLFSIPSSLSS
ncbi:hypothetical protein V501_03568 [Pseudogymnoascus sp. VKM F-4519 (FW-2642)]|nr:hypothetical protein V501_03568 [Pseudogymnoascus sp. VKM F-4519 (FW-2642)]